MLSSEDLNAALTAALKAADPPCGRLCRAGAEREESTYRVWHNAISSSSTDVQVIHSAAALALDKDAMAARLAAWIRGCHLRRTGVDLNGAM